MMTTLKPTLTSMSLFSGAGGMDVGLHQAGFVPLACCEIDEHAAATISAWLNKEGIQAPVMSDVIQIEPGTLLTDLNLQRGELDLMFGGSPCQSYSLIGKRRSLEDERGELLFEIPRLARVLQPKVILMEQVKGLLSAPGYDGERGGALQELLRRLDELNYRVQYRVLNAADYGVPQVRQRLFLVAARSEFVFPDPTHSKAGNSLFGLKPYRTTGEAISDLPPPVLSDEVDIIPNHRDITPSRDRERIRDVPEGDYLARQLHLGVDVRCRLDPKKDTTKFRRLHRQEPALTLRGGEMAYHPTEPRYLTPREAMRLHGFPDDHVLHGPLRGRSGTFRALDQHRLVANAVPPPLARILGEAIVQQFFSERFRVPVCKEAVS